MSNSMALMGTVLQLSLELGDLKYSLSTIRPRRPAPMPSWGARQAPTVQVSAALEWVVACSAQPLAAEPPRRFEIHAAPYSLPAKNLRLDIDVLTVSENELLHCYVVDYDRYVGWNSDRLNGLFGFMQSVIWRRWTSGPLLMRLATEPTLPELTRAVLHKYQEAERRKVAALETCWEAVAGMFPECKLVYEMLQNQDATALEGLSHEALGLAGIKFNDDFAQCLEALRTQAADSMWLKQFFKHRVVFHVLVERLGPGTFDWHSAEYWKLKAEAEKEKTRATSAATQYYTEEFHRFCLSAPVAELADGLFKPYQITSSRPFEDFIKELVTTRKPLKQEQQLL